MILAVKNIVLILELGKSLIWITTHKIITHETSEKLSKKI